MRTAAFIISPDGQGHIVRCGALMAELRSRGWECLLMEWLGNRSPDVFVVDYPGVLAPGLTVSIRDIPSDDHADLILSGRELVRPEFRVRWVGGHGTFDVREIHGMNAMDLAAAMSAADLVITYGGMRAMECRCVGAPMVVIPRNEGERINVKFLRNGGGIDGLGCTRAADLIEELV